MSELRVAGAAVSPGKDSVLLKLKETFGRLFGTPSAELDVDTPFLALGADSLFLLQSSQAIQEKFGVKVPFRLLLDELPTIASVASFIEGKMPSETMAAPAKVPANGGAPATLSDKSDNLEAGIQHQPTLEQSIPFPAPDLKLQRSFSDYSADCPPSAIDEVLIRQLQIMSQQLDLLSNGKLVVETERLEHSHAVALSSMVQASESHLTNSHPGKIDAATNGSQVTEPNADVPESEIESEVFIPYQPIPKQPSRVLTARQEKHVAALIERLCKRTPKSKNLAQEYRQFHADNRSSAGFRSLWKEMFYPLVVDHGEGSRIWDIDENEYVDLTMGFGALLFGHSPPFIIDALQEQIKRGIQLGGQSPFAGKSAKLICELTGVERVAFCNSGTEAIMSALRLARTVTGRSRIALFEGSYHGTFDEVLVKRGEESGDGTLRAVPVAPGVPKHLVQNVMVLKYDSAESLELLRKHAPELAAVLVEPPRSRRPDVQPKEFLLELRRITEKSGTALIFDEVVTGFRFHPGGAQKIFGVQSDLVTYGKAIGGGVPVAVVAGKAAFMDAIDGGMWNYGDSSFPEAETTYFAGTFFKHPLTMAAVWAALNHIKESGPKLQEELERKTTALANTLNSYFEQDDVPIRVVYFGSLLRFVYRLDLKMVMPLFYYHLLEKGVYICETRNCFLSTAHTDNDIEYVVRMIKETIEELREAGFQLYPLSTPHVGSTAASTDSEGATDRAAEAASQDSKSNTSGGQAQSVDGGPASVLTLPLTEAQKQLWVLAQMGDDASVAYNLSLTLRLTGPLQLEAMRKAVQTVVDRHEALRTTFSPDGNYQRVASKLRMDIPLIEFPDTDEAERELKMSEWLARQAKEPFDLVNGPLIRFGIAAVDHQSHLATLTTHHVVSDGYSLGIVLRELRNLYSSYCREEAPRLPDAMQFSHYIEWQSKWQQGPEMEEAETYWLNQFSGSIPILDLPADRPRPPVQTFSGARECIEIEASLFSGVEGVSERNSCTPFMTLLAAFKVLLSRLANQQDLVIGVPSAGQASLGSRSLVGYCINPLPVRTRPESDLAFVNYLASVKRSILDASEYQNYPFSNLVKKLGGPRDASRPPLFSVMFNLDRASHRSRFHGLDEQQAANPTGTAQFDIDLNISETRGELLLECDYNTDLFNGQTIRRWLGHFRTLLEGIVAHPDRRLSDLPLLTRSEQNHLLKTRNDTWTSQPRDICFSTLFESQVERTPHAVAAVYGNNKITYGDLNRRSNRIARLLMERGAGPESVIAIAMERSLDMLACIIAAFKAGAAYLPVDPEYPAERIRMILDDSQAALALTHQGLLDEVEREEYRIIAVDRESEEIHSKDGSNPAARATPNNLAYVIYTSGSTGKPKGAMIEQGGMINHLHAKIADLNLSSSDTIGQTASQCFDISVWQFLSALMVGGSVVIMDGQITHDPERLIEEVEATGVTILETVPTMLKEIIRSLRQRDEEGTKEMSRLRWLVVTGEALERELCSEWLTLRPGVKMMNAYGPTECSDDVTHHVIDTEQSGTECYVPIGRPLANTQIYITDKHQRVVPIGVRGEICVGGEGVGRGYLNDAAKTAEAFVADGLGGQVGGRLYRTGDLGRWREDGRIEFLGRVDEQLKVRGYRIETGEIEAALKEDERVKDAVVVARTDEGREKRLVAYVVTKAEVGSSELRSSLGRKLPQHMIPAAFVKMRSIPLTPNGKVDKQSLPAPAESDLEKAAAYAAARTPTEQMLVEIWQEVLGVNQIGITDNFFELGGDSILSIQIIARARKAGIIINPRQMFQYQQIAELAAVAGSHWINHADQGLVTGPFELTPIQEWFFEQGFEDAHHWNQSALLEVEQGAREPDLREAFTHILKQHDALRMRFAREDGKWTGALANPEQDVAFKRIDAQWEETGLNGRRTELEAEITREKEAAQRGLDIEKGPMILGVYFDHGKERAGRLLIVAHHLIVDNVSWQILLDGLSKAYNQLKRGEPVDLGDKTTSFKQWSNELREYAHSEQVRNEADYWTAERRHSVKRIPVDKLGGDNKEGSGRNIVSSLSEEETTALLQEVPRAYRTMINDVLLTGLMECYRNWTGEEMMLVDVEGHGREDLFEGIDVTRTVGWFTAICPMLIDVSGVNGIGERLKRVKEQVRGVANGGIGYGILKYLSEDEQLKEELRRQPRAEIVFNYMGRTGGGTRSNEGSTAAAFKHAGESRGASRSPNGERAWLIEINGSVSGGRLQMVWTYSEDLHERETIEKLATGFNEALRRIIEHCKAPEAHGFTPSDFLAPDMSQEELDELIVELSVSQE